MAMNGQAATLGIAPVSGVMNFNGVMNCLTIEVVVPLVLVPDQGKGLLG